MTNSQEMKVITSRTLKRECGNMFCLVFSSKRMRVPHSNVASFATLEWERRTCRGGRLVRPEAQSAESTTSAQAERKVPRSAAKRRKVAATACPERSRRDASRG